MNRRVSLASSWLLFFFVACAGDDNSGAEVTQAGASPSGTLGAGTGTDPGASVTPGGTDTGTGGSTTTPGGTVGAGTGTPGAGTGTPGAGTPGAGTGQVGIPGSDDAATDDSASDDAAGAADDSAAVVDDSNLTDDSSLGDDSAADDSAADDSAADDSNLGDDVAADDSAAVDDAAPSDDGAVADDSTADDSSVTDDAPAEPVVIERPPLVTSGPNAYWQTGEITEAAGGNATVTVNEGSEQQDWIGFGGTFNEAGWDALGEVSEADRARAIELLFDPAEGIGLTYGRIPVGSSDYGLDRYSLAPTANDYAMNDFSIDRDRQDLIPYIKAAQSVKPDIKFWASPWSPPPWMKDNNAFDRGNMKNDAQTLGAHALYLARFVEEYEGEGIIVEAVHPQNEPGYQQDYPSCGWSGNQMSDYIVNHLAPTLAERGLNTEIWLGTLSNDQTDHSIGQNVMGNAQARALVKGIGLQWGMEAHVSSYTQYGVPVMQTEHRCGNYPWEGSYRSDRAPNDHAYALESWGLFKGWITKGVNSYLAWNMVLDTVGRNLDNVRPWNQNALLVVDRQAGTLTITPYYWVFRHLAQYVMPGAVRVGTQGGDALAFKNPDGSIVTILHNSGGQASQTTLSVGGKMLQFQIPGQGWATVNYEP